MLEENQEQCLKAGMDGFLTKPVRADELAKTVRQWLGGGVVASSARSGQPTRDAAPTRRT